jgi:hypothetical protein
MRVSYHLPLLVAIALAGSPASARAEDQTYRIAVTATDLASATVFTAGVKMDLDCRSCFVTLAIGFVGMALGAPIIHASEGNYGRMGISLGARVVLPTLGTIAAARLKASENSILAGFLIGFLVATAIDVAMASEDTDPTAARVLSIGTRF